MHYTLRSLLFFFFLVSFFALSTVFAFAQSAAGVQILPAVIEESLDPGAVLETKMTVRNVSTGEQTYYLLRRDISGVRDNSTPIFAEEGMEVTGYELSEWITLSEEPIILSPGASADIPVKITVPANATPGSHFGGIFVSVEPPRLRQTGASIGYDVGAIVSIRISGDVVENARIREFSTDRLIYGKPKVLFTTRVENPGNVLIRPRGPLEVYNMFGKRVALINVNDQLGGVFPGTTRPFEVTWEEKDFAIGRYQGIVALIYGEEGRETTVSATVSFWVLPVNVILPIIGILAFIVLAVYFGVRVHIRRTLERYQTPTAGRRPIYRRRDNGVARLTMVAVAMLVVVALFLIGLLIVFA